MAHHIHHPATAAFGGPYEAIEYERLREAIDHRELGTDSARRWAVAHLEGDPDVNGTYPWEVLTYSQRVRAFQEIVLALSEQIRATMDADRYPHRYNRRMLRMVHDLQMRYAHIVDTGPMPDVGYDLDDPDEDAPPRLDRVVATLADVEQGEWAVDYGPAQHSGEFRLFRNRA